MNKHFKIKGNYAFFYGGCLSQWWSCQFSDKTGITYNCAEQYMMYQKAMLFGDVDVSIKILKADTPKLQKELGRKVQNFDPVIWEENCKLIVFNGNILKFSQNKNLLQILLSTYPYDLVEASPYDAIWGIKRGIDYKNIENPDTWLGKNYLGKILTLVRKKLKN